MHPEDLHKQIAFDDRSVAVVMNHNYVRDRAVTEAVLQTSISYIGLLGPRNRAMRIARELQAIEPHAAKRLYGPVGLDIGAETPEEIAASIVAEIQAAMAGRSGGMLRGRTQSIHAAVRVLG